MSATWEIFALRFAVDPNRPAFQWFLGGSGGDAPMPVAYHAFLLRGPAGVVVMDTASDAARCARYGKQAFHGLDAALAVLGVAPADVADVVQTHLHWDHAGQPDLFPAARFHLQRREMAYVNGPAMRHAVLRAGYEAADIQAATALLHGGRMVLHDGAAGIAPGLSLHHVGGHTDGLQMVRVRTRRGWMCLATDAVAHRQNLDRRIPFPAVLHVGDALDAFDIGLALADAPDLLIPGHDCWVVDAHPAAAPGTAGWLARLD
ncbi:MAG TPA: N-acyl homoserine lactonase family protein [Falsiroseomonas sp.]|jgi:glyoxylase-like metal-dependent hydrolase (beta-lactamase superfamily II)|nr:N-acyl homoserine lactonase family protein [Falsiroseomonas sp.]